MCSERRVRRLLEERFDRRRARDGEGGGGDSETGSVTDKEESNNWKIYLKKCYLWIQAGIMADQCEYNANIDNEK